MLNNILGGLVIRTTLLGIALSVFVINKYKIYAIGIKSGKIGVWVVECLAGNNYITF